MLDVHVQSTLMRELHGLQAGRMYVKSGWDESEHALQTPKTSWHIGPETR